MPGPYTVSNDIAGASTPLISGVTIPGDIEVPVKVRLTGISPGGGLGRVIIGRHTGAGSSYWTTAFTNDVDTTTVGAAGTNYSGANYQQTSFATTPGWARRVYGSVTLAAGSYRAFLRMAVNPLEDSTDIRARLLTDTGAGGGFQMGPTEELTSSTIAEDTMTRWVDLGGVDVPFTIAVPWELWARRVASASQLRFDFPVFVPTDSYLDLRLPVQENDKWRGDEFANAVGTLGTDYDVDSEAGTARILTTTGKLRYHHGDPTTSPYGQTTNDPANFAVADWTIENSDAASTAVIGLYGSGGSAYSRSTSSLGRQTRRVVLYNAASPDKWYAEVAASAISGPITVNDVRIGRVYAMGSADYFEVAYDGRGRAYKADGTVLSGLRGDSPLIIPPGAHDFVVLFEKITGSGGAAENFTLYQAVLNTGSAHTLSVDFKSLTG